MSRLSGWWLGLVLAAGWSSSAAAQELPKTTREGRKVAEELINLCITEGGLKLVGEGREAMWRIDRAKLRATLAGRREQLTPAVRDALVVAMDNALNDSAQKNLRPMFLAVLEALGQEAKDELAKGFAAFFTARTKERQSTPEETGEAYERAAKHFASAAQPAWQATPDAVFTDDKATEAAVKKASADGDLAHYRYVHFVTHGILGMARAEPPALVLSLVGTTAKEDEYGRDDGFLKLPEVSALKLNADLVVLSACRSGRGRMYNGEGVSSLARVFLYAGSRGVVCSLWSVDDAATSQLMQSMYRRLQTDGNTADALRAAKLAMIREGRAPVYWAPFVHIGR